MMLFQPIVIEPVPIQWVLVGEITLLEMGCECIPVVRTLTIRHNQYAIEPPDP